MSIYIPGSHEFDQFDLFDEVDEAEGAEYLWSNDTGLGGIQAAKKLLEEGEFEVVYCFTDPEYAPYGPKSDIVLRSRVISNVQYAQTFLQREIERKTGKKCDPIKSYGLYACNTASTVLDDVRHHFNPIYGSVISVIDPIFAELESLGLIHATMSEHDSMHNNGRKVIGDHEVFDDLRALGSLSARKPKHQKVHMVIFGTIRTIESRFYHNHLEGALPNSKVIGIACPKLASFIDYGISPKIIKAYIRKSVEQLLRHDPDIQGAQIFVVLACTHFQQVSEYFAKSFQDAGIKNPHILNQHKLALDYMKSKKSKMKLRPPEKEGIRLVLRATGDIGLTYRMLMKILPPTGYVEESTGIFRIGMNNVDVGSAILPYTSHDLRRRTWHHRGVTPRGLTL